MVTLVTLTWCKFVCRRSHRVQCVFYAGNFNIRSLVCFFLSWDSVTRDKNRGSCGNAVAYFWHLHALLLFTADILLSFSEHPPLKLPAAGFVLDLENGPTDQSFDDYLEAIKKAINPGNQNEIHPSSTCTLNSVRQWNLDLSNLYNEVLGITNDFLQPG